MKCTAENAQSSMELRILSTTSRRRRAPTVWTSGPKNAILRKTTRSPRSTSRARCPATPTSMTTAIGATSRNTDTCGLPGTLTWAGRPTAWVIGIGWAHGAGAGLTLNPGALLLSTTAAGIISVAGGAGAQGRSSGPQFTALRSLVSLAAGAFDSDSAFAAGSVGSRLDLGNPSFLVSVAAAGLSRVATSGNPLFAIP